MLLVFVINCGINYHRESFRKIRAQNTDVFGERLASNLSMADRRGQSSEYTGRELKTESCSAGGDTTRSSPVHAGTWQAVSCASGILSESQAGAGFRNPIISETDGNLCAIYDRGKL